MLGERDRVTIDPIEHALRQHDVVARHGGQVVERDDGLRSESELLRSERHDLAAVHVALAHQVGDLGEEPLCRRALGRHHLDARSRTTWPHHLVRSGDEGDERRAIDLDEVKTELHHRQDAFAVEMEVHPVDRALGETKAVGRSSAVHEVREAEAPLALVLGGEPDQLGGVSRHLEVRLHGHLQVGLLEPLELFGDHGHAHRLAAQMLA